ncbi:MAG: hypothetical protein ACI9MJ_000315 [Alphaproteobacteria bacterium]
MRSFGLNLTGRRSGRSADAAGPAAMRQRAEESASQLPPLMVAADHVAATVAQGVHGRRRVGQGDSFWQFRQYQPGDPLSRIDWRQTAKRQHVFIRETEWEAAQSVWLWLDRSSSMRYCSGPDLPEKFERAAILTLALASLLVRGGERIAMLGAGEPPSTGRAVLERYALEITRQQRAGAEAEESSEPPRGALPRHARVVMVSDFLMPPEALLASLRDFATMGVRGHLVQIYDPAEQTLPFSGRVKFEGLEGEGAAMIGRVEAVRNDYIALMQTHRKAIEDIARNLGWTLTVHGTHHTPQTALLALYEALSEPLDSL